MAYTVVSFDRQALRAARERSARIMRRAGHKRGVTKAAKVSGLVATAALLAGAVGGALYMRKRG